MAGLFFWESDMEPVILKKKMELLDPATDGHVREALEAALSSDQTLIQALPKYLNPLFLDFFARLCHEEGVDRLTNQEQEKGLKDRLPDTIANWLTVLSEILITDSPSSKRVADPVYTATVLLLRLYEWINLNYDRRFIYGLEVEKEAERLFQTLENEMDLIGDKDEILAQGLQGLSGFCGNYKINHSTLLPGVKTYFVEVEFDYGKGPRFLNIGIKSVLVDQVKFRALCSDQHILAHILENLFALSSIGISTPGNYI